VHQDNGANEYLIKRFADKANKKAGEFYTNRTVIYLMTKVMELNPGESDYDPTCSTGGMLFDAGIVWWTVSLIADGLDG
jgi:type I restriction enzyme M protein